MNEELLKALLTELQDINANISYQNKQIEDLLNKLESVTATCQGSSFIKISS